MYQPKNSQLIFFYTPIITTSKLSETNTVPQIEAFINDGVITKAGLAFSRDGPKKVYIQHKMLDDVEALVRMLYEEEGVFYLCGPTWPVPDVYETLVKAFEKHCGMDAAAADAFLERLKVDERYVLEVY